jgi:Carboxypeptidase regulatory-like domain
MTTFRYFVSIGAVLLVAAGAEAHALGIEVKRKVEKLIVEVYYDDDSPATDAKVVLTDESDRMIVEGRTDANGFWTVPTLPPGRYRIVADAGDGHLAKKRFDVSADATTPAIAPTEGAVVSDGPTRAETTGIRRWVLTGLGLATIALGTAALRFASRRRPATRDESR